LEWGGAQLIPNAGGNKENLFLEEKKQNVLFLKREVLRKAGRSAGHGGKGEKGFG